MNGLPAAFGALSREIDHLGNWPGVPLWRAEHELNDGGMVDLNPGNPEHHGSIFR
jgi:hypothetical protein